MKLKLFEEFESKRNEEVEVLIIYNNGKIIDILENDDQTEEMLDNYENWDETKICNVPKDEWDNNEINSVNITKYIKK